MRKSIRAKSRQPSARKIFFACRSISAASAAVSFAGHWYFPVVQDLPEDTFGPDFLPTSADYSAPDVQAAIAARGFALWPPIPNSIRVAEAQALGQTIFDYEPRNPAAVALQRTAKTVLNILRR